MKAKNYLLVISTIFIMSACSAAGNSKTELSSKPTSTPAKKDLNEIDLASIKHIAAKGRAQDGSLEGENFVKLTIAEDLLAHGKDCIPYLISKLDDETEMDNSTLDFWYQVHVGDVALIILNDFFVKDDGLHSTVAGFGWNDFLERGNDKNLTGEEILRRYIRKHGRKNIKMRWQKFWEDNKENIVWDETERCFKLKQNER